MTTRLRPSRSASPSIDYPGPRIVAGSLSPDDDDGIDFECSRCGRTFYVRSEHYEGQWDHPPNEPVCPKCAEDDE